MWEHVDFRKVNTYLDLASSIVEMGSEAKGFLEHVDFSKAKHTNPATYL